MVATRLIAAAFLTLASAIPATPKLVVHESLSSVPNGFTRDGAPPSASFNLRIALKSNDMEGLHKALYDVSTPNSTNYGKYLTKEEVEEFVKPSTGTVDAVNKWLASYGLKPAPISPAGEWLSFDVNVKTANELLGANFSTFTHAATGTKSIRTLSYSIPENLKDHVDLLHPTTIFPVYGTTRPTFSVPVSPSPNPTPQVVPGSCAQGTTPACLQTINGIPSKLATQPFNRLGVTGFSNQHAQYSDLQQFLLTFRPDLNSFTSFALETLDGGNNNQGPSEEAIEANVDTQYTVGLASNVPVRFISVGNQNFDNVFGLMDVTLALLAEAAPPQTLTTSYSFNEVDLSPALEINLCNAYAQLGARGVSILFATGDGGVAGVLVNGQPRPCTTFAPSFPPSCPFVTSVGASRGFNPETASVLSAGGFSNVFAVPSYQAFAVSSYLFQLGSINAGRFNRNGRGIPDVAAAGENIQIFLHGRQTLVHGTSCSCPIFASVIALLNDELAASGRPPLGFLNPLLYSIAPSALNDVTSGNNPGCGTAGFPAVAGWDPVTGLGTANYPALKAALGLR